MKKVLSIVKDFIKNIAISLWFIIKLPFLFIRLTIKCSILFIKFIKVRTNSKWFFLGSKGIRFILKCIIFIVWDFSGIRYIWSKIKPPFNKDEKLPTYRRPATFFLWIVGIYVALFGIASNRYENRADKIENRMNAIYAQIPKDMEVAFSRIDDVQNMVCPYKPNIFQPVSIIKSFKFVVTSDEYQKLIEEKKSIKIATWFFKHFYLVDIKYDDGIEQLKQLIEDWAQKTKEIKGKEVGELYGFDLKGVHLENANLRKAHLEKANLEITHLENANLWKANLEKANLYEAHLENADLWEANLKNANLWKANLEDANLRYAHLENAEFEEAHLENAYFYGAHLENANLRHSHLENADLWEANLEKADLEGAHLENAYFYGANLEDANLRYAHLEDANLEGVHLEKADLRKANLKNADLWKANLENADLWKANLENADLWEANLKNADLWDANLENALFCNSDLKNAKNLTAEQLSKVFSLWSVKNLDTKLKEKLKKINPKLFEPNYEVYGCNDEEGLWWSDYLKKQKK